MTPISKIGLPAFAILAGAAIAFAPQIHQARAQGAGRAAAPPGPTATVNDPAGAPPDPTHIPIVLPPDIKWTGTVGRSQSAVLYGDPNKVGSPYGVLMKWYPGNFSRPHFHVAERWIYVISGTWWVSASNTYDERTTYPVPAGSFVQDMVRTVHWDGDRTGAPEPTVLLITGIGPAANTPVDANGQPLPAGAGRGGNGGGGNNGGNYGGGAAPAPGR